MAIAEVSPTDPLYASQWHLALIGRLGLTGTAFDGLERVWASYTGAGVRLGVWDDGVQRTHWDLAANYDSSGHLTINGTLNDGLPITSRDGHGTSVGGLIAAAANGLGGVGVAYGASITGVRIFGGADDINSQRSRYLQTLDHLGDFSVTNHSYGRFPDFALGGDVAKFAAASNGRGGLGTVNVKSAGNDNVDGNGNALDASRFTITVGALDSSGQVTSYSTYGAHLLVSAPAGSVTTDLLGGGTGYDGLLSGDYTNGFGGTSAAGPITAGVVTLMLDANADLGWRDVQNILAYSASGVGSLQTGVTANENFAWKWNGADNWNGGGLHYSEDYGYGLVNAFTAVRFAEVWSVLNDAAATSANEVSITTGSLAANRTIADRSTLSYSFTVTQNISLEHVALTINLQHTFFTDLRIRLTSPDGTTMSLYNGSTGSGSTSDNGLTYTFGLDGLRGEMSAGSWTLQIEDAAQGDSGRLNSVTFIGFGTAVTSNDVYHYTDEVLSVLAKNGQGVRLTLADVDGGIDWLNASAMWRDVVVDLNAGGICTLAGQTFAVMDATGGIENAVCGDGNDRVVGNSLDNVLMGMRGDDILIAGAGVDTARFIGARSEYVVSALNGVTTVSHALFGTDTLTGVEFLSFGDVTIADPSAGYVPPDTTAPTVSFFSPADGATGASVSGNIVLTFSEAIQRGTGDIVIRSGSAAGAIVETFNAATSTRLTLSGSQLTIDPTSNLSGNTQYFVTFAAGSIRDLAGNNFAGTTTYDFRTGGNPQGTEGDDILDGDSFNNTILGNSGNDLIRGWSGADTLLGGDGNDTIIGGEGYDSLTGGKGADRFVFTNINDFSGFTAGGREMIADFNRSQGDKIDLSLIDAKALTGFHDRFGYLGNTAVGGAFEGYVRWSFDPVQGGVVIYGTDIPWTSVSFSVFLPGITSLSRDDFIL